MKIGDLKDSQRIAECYVDVVKKIRTKIETCVAKKVSGFKIPAIQPLLEESVKQQ